MAEITIVCNEGADITIDGVSWDDIVPPEDDTPDAIDVFRSECLTGGCVSCDWDTLHARLTNHDIATFWWLLTESERRSIAEMAIKNMLFYILSYGRSGKTNCGGGEGDIKQIACVQNGLVRILKFGTSPIGGGSCYYRRYADSKEYCYVPATSYGLPCNLVICATYADAASDSTFGHTMCSIQVVDGTDSIDNWIIFQYSSFDIKSGNWQIPGGKYDLYVDFIKMLSISCGGYSYKTVARFNHI